MSARNGNGGRDWSGGDRAKKYSLPEYSYSDLTDMVLALSILSSQNYGELEGRLLQKYGPEILRKLRKAALSEVYHSVGEVNRG